MPCHAGVEAELRRIGHTLGRRPVPTRTLYESLDVEWSSREIVNVWSDCRSRKLT